jgi:hypothetical protein
MVFLLVCNHTVFLHELRFFCHEVLGLRVSVCVRMHVCVCLNVVVCVCAYVRSVYVCVCVHLHIPT